MTVSVDTECIYIEEPDPELSLFSEKPKFKGWGIKNGPAFVLFEFGRPIAFAKARIRGSCQIDLDFLVVAQDRRHEGIGSLFLREIFEFANKLPLNTIISFEGFTQDGREYLLPKLKQFESEFSNVSVYTYSSC